MISGTGDATHKPPQSWNKLHAFFETNVGCRLNGQNYELHSSHFNVHLHRKVTEVTAPSDNCSTRADKKASDFFHTHRGPDLCLIFQLLQVNGLVFVRSHCNTTCWLVLLGWCSV